MQRSFQLLLGTLVVGLLIGGTAGYAHYRQGVMRNFRMVADAKLYRSGQMSLAGLKQAVHDYGIKTVVTLRDAVYPDDPPPDRAEEGWCAAENINYCRISPRTWWAPDGSIPAEEGVRRFREIMDDAHNWPVLIHCFAGIHRTGAFCAVYRMEYEHWTNEEAIAELMTCGYRDLADEWDLLDFLKQYQPRWKRDGLPAHPESQAGAGNGP